MSEKHARVVKCCAYAIALVLLHLLHTTLRLKIDLFGLTVTLTPFFLAAIALYEGPYMGAAFGFAAGLLADSAGMRLEGLLPVWYMLFFAAAGYLCARYFRRLWVSCLIFGAVCTIAQNALTYVFYYYLFFRAAFVPLAVRALANLALSAALSFAPYLLVPAVYRRFAGE